MSLLDIYALDGPDRDILKVFPPHLFAHAADRGERRAENQEELLHQSYLVLESLLGDLTPLSIDELDIGCEFVQCRRGQNV